jgi:hypothetical protein
MTSYWWFSFVDPDAEGDKSLGACIVVARSSEEALLETILQGCNPGPYADVRFGRVSNKRVHEMLLKFPINKLLSTEELNAKGEFTEYQRRTETHH